MPSMKTRNKPDLSPSISQNKKQSLHAHENPLARDARGSARRDEIRAMTQMVSAPRESNRPMERSNQKRAHSR